MSQLIKMYSSSFSYRNMFVSLSHIILIIAVVVAEQQIKLEDIERDNLLSERRSNKQGNLKIDQPQHSRTPDSQSHEV